MANSNIINAVFGSGICAVTTSAYRANYGMILRFSGIALPTAFEVDFSNYDVMGRDSITMIGQNGEVQIPDDLWDSGLNIYAYVYLHPTDDSGVTVYTATIPVLGRPNRTEEEPTPHEQSVIEQAISALNDAVEQTAADVVAADASASAAAQSEANAATSERSAAASAGAALASQNAAHASETASAQSAQSASGSAEQASQSAQASAASADTAQGAAASAERSEQNASASAASAQSKANEAASSASTASGKANEASASATAAAQSASSAASSAQNAASAATAAESSATDAEQAKTDAQDAQAAAEQAAQSVSGLSEQIAQNTSDIADLVQSKAGALIDTATGSIASFVPDATVPTVKGLIVDIEPVQDLHGYANPWPAGGGKNLLPSPVVGTYALNGITAMVLSDGTITVTGAKNVSTGMVITIPLAESFNATNGQYLHIRNSVAISNTTFRVGTFERALSTVNRIAEITSDYADISTISLYITAQVTEELNLIVQPSVEEGSTATAWTPYSNICPIGGWDAIEVQRTGVNVWDEEWVNGRWAGNEGAFNPAFSSYLASKNPIHVLPNTTYYFFINSSIISGREIVYYDASDNWISDAPSMYANRMFTTPSNCHHIRFNLGSAYGTTYNNDISINYPSTDTAYHSGKDNTTYTIQLGQTVYGGTVDVTNGVLTVDRAMYVADGSESVPSVSHHTSGLYYTIVKGNLGAKTTNPLPISSRFKAQSSVAVGNCYVTSVGQLLVAVLPDQTATTKEAATQWFADNPTQFVYELATPITISLTPIEISVLTGQTNNIWADSGDVSVDYAADLKTYIDQKIAAAVAALS